jgi:hypothetical protein
VVEQSARNDTSDRPTSACDKDEFACQSVACPPAC